MTDGPISLASRRWDAGDNSPSSHSVRDCLEVVMTRLDAGEIKPEHIIVIYGSDSEGTGDDGFYQAGSLGAFAQIGLIARIQHLMVTSE